MTIVKVTKDNYRSIRRKAIRIVHGTVKITQGLNKRYNSSDFMTNSQAQKALSRDLRRVKRKAFIEGDSK